MSFLRDYTFSEDRGLLATWGDKLIYLYQTVEAGQAVSDGFTALNIHGADASESYRSLRKFFQENVLDEQGLYGFFPASFSRQTGLQYKDIVHFVEAHPGMDAYTINPLVWEAHAFLNVFEQQEFSATGLREFAQNTLHKVGLDLNLLTWATDAGVTTGCQYILAKPVFWKTWLDLSGGAFEGNPGAQVSDAAFSMQCVVAEGLASLVLDLDSSLQVKAFDPFSLPAIAHRIEADKDVLQRLNALKNAWRDAGDVESLTEFSRLREQPLSRVRPANSGWNDEGLFYACISHIPLPVEMPEEVTTFYMGSASHEGVYNSATYAPEWVEHNATIAGMEGLFAIRNYILQHRPDVKRIGICSYRKFVSEKPVSDVRAQGYEAMFVVTEEMRQRRSLAVMMDPGMIDFIVGPLEHYVVRRADGNENRLSTMLEQYAVEHHIEDLLRMAAVAVELGVLENNEVCTFLGMQRMFIGGVELGIFPAEFWLKAVGDTENVLRECIRLYPERREGYQQRQWAFCAERLTSYMILRYMQKRYGVINGFDRFLNLINKGNETTYITGGLPRT